MLASVLSCPCHCNIQSISLVLQVSLADVSVHCSVHESFFRDACPPSLNTGSQKENLFTFFSSSHRGDRYLCLWVKAAVLVQFCGQSETPPTPPLTSSRKVDVRWGKMFADGGGLTRRWLRFTGGRTNTPTSARRQDRTS